MNRGRYRWLGHASITTTDTIYAHLYPSDYTRYVAQFAAFGMQARRDWDLKLLHTDGMKTEDLTLWVQAAAGVVAILASLAALFISWRDRVNGRGIAAEDRRATLEQAKLMFDLDALIRLQQNRNRGGSSDKLESVRMGAESLTLVALIGPELLPRQWKAQVDADDDEIRALFDDAEFPEFKKNAAETQLAVNATLRRIAELVKRS